MKKQRQKEIFNKQAAQYDKRRGNPKEGRWRQPLLSHASGEVLELAVGAGANFPFYPREVRVTATDFSEAMLAKAKQAAKFHRIEADFISGDIEEMDFPNQSFDTIVSTLSMCSYEKPSLVLEKINRWCKPDGKILLMEHGISSNVMISSIQKALNPLLFRFSGCHNTRNIVDLIRKSGMTIERIESSWFDMVHRIWAKPK